MTEIVVTLAILLVIVLLALMASYNGLMQLRQQVRAAWGEMDAGLKRRYELLPKLVNLVQTAGVADATTLSAVVNAKHQATIAFHPPELAKAETALAAAIHAVFGAAESEPSLSSDSRFVQIREQLLESGAKIEQSRQKYNDSVLTYNAAVAGFPYNLSAVIFGFTLQPTFDVN
jgi:LemA protein